LIANTDTIPEPAGSVPGRTSRPAMRGEYISIFCTGLGDVSNRPATGAPASATNLSLTVAVQQVGFGIIGGGGVYTTSSFSGLALGFVGLYQVNVMVPLNAPVGDAVSVSVIVNGNSSGALMAIQ
jgi:uncharacterized protein (TIGR03437 family)